MLLKVRCSWKFQSLNRLGEPKVPTTRFGGECIIPSSLRWTLSDVYHSSLLHLPLISTTFPHVLTSYDDLQLQSRDLTDSKMSAWGRSRPPIIIDLLSDDDESEMVDLISVDDQRVTSYVLHKPELKVEDESSTLVGSSTIGSGKSTPTSSQDDDTAQTKSDPTDVGGPSPENPQQQGNSSSDDELTLSAILTRIKKRKHDSDDARASEARSTDVPTPLAPKALSSMFAFQSVKPGINKFFSILKRTENETNTEKSQQEDSSKTTRDETPRAFQRRQSTQNSNSRILNIDREEVFGREEKKKRRRRKHFIDQSPQKKPAEQQNQSDGKIQNQFDGHASSAAAPPRAVSEPRDTIHPKKKFRSHGVERVRPPQTGEEIESQRPQKRRKYSDRDDNTITSQATSVGEPGDFRPKTNGVERSHPAGKDKATDIHEAPGRYRPGNPHSNRLEKATRHDRRHKKDSSRDRKGVHKAKRSHAGGKQRENAHLVAALNGRGAQTSKVHQRTGTASQRPLERRLSQPATPDLNRVLHEGHDGHLIPSYDTRGSQPPLESEPGRKSVPDRNNLSCEAREWPNELNSGATQSQMPLESNTNLPNKELREPQQARHDDAPQGSRSTQTQINDTQSSGHLRQVYQAQKLHNHEKDLEAAAAFFKNHPSNSVPKPSTFLIDSVPANMGKPGYSHRYQMVKNNAGKRSGRKGQNAIQKAEKRDRDRQRQITRRRIELEAKANQLWPNESNENKEVWVEKGIAKLKEIFAKNDQKREAEESQGLLTVDELEQMGGAGNDLINWPAAAAPKGKRRGIPMAEALEPGATIVLYVVYISDPAEKDKDFGDYDMKRLGDQFLRIEDANKHAETVLRNDRLHDSSLVSIQFQVDPKDGLFFGTKELANGKRVMCMVLREKQMSSKLDLRDVSVRKELKDLYCPRFDVFHTYVIPRVFLEDEEATVDDGDEGKEKKSKPKPRPETPSTDTREDVAQPGEKEDADGDGDSLFSASPTPEPEAEAEAQDEHGSDAESVTTDVTLEPSEPAGYLDSLSWDDVEYVHELVGSFTTKELANREALRVATERWKPRGSRMDSWLHYNYSVKPSLNEIWAQDLDVDLGVLDFDVPVFEGHVRDRPWRFVSSKVYVKETRLQGPRDIGSYVVTGNGEDDDGEGGAGKDGGDGEDGEDGEDDGERMIE